MEQLFLGESVGPCGCWRQVDSSGLVVAGHACADCVARALDFLEAMLQVDKVVSVSALEPEPEELLINGPDRGGPDPLLGGY